MKTKSLKWSEIQTIEDGFYENIKTSLTNAVASIMESKIDTVGLAPTMFYFHANDEAYCAEWTLSEDTLKIKNVCKIDLDEADVNKKWDETADQLVEAIIEDKDAKGIWDSLLELCSVKMSKKRKLRKPRKAIAETKTEPEKTQIKNKSKIVAVLKESVEKVSKLVDDFFGSEQETEYTFDLNEGKLVKEKVPVKPIMRNIEEARQAAKQLDWNEYFKDKQKFLDVNEEVYFLTKDELKGKLSEIASFSFDIDDKDIPKEVNRIMEQRESQEDTIKNIFSSFLNTKEKDIDTIILEAEQIFDTDKKNFMEDLVDILKEIFETVSEESDDIATQEKAKRFLGKLNDELSSEEGVDKDVLAELAKSAVELASTLEGLEDTSSIDKDELMNKPGVDTNPQTKTPAIKQAFEDVETDLAKTADDLGTMDAINPDGDEFAKDEPEEEQEDWKELHCDKCDADFKVDMNKVREMKDEPAGDNDSIDNDDKVEVNPLEAVEIEDPIEKAEPSALDQIDMDIETEAECQEVRCPYCEAKVSTCEDDEDDKMIDNALDGLDMDKDAIKTEAGPAADQPAQELAGNVNYKVPVKKGVNEQSPAADYEYIVKAHANSMVNPTPGNSGTKGGFKKLDNKSNKADDNSPGETIVDKKGSGFKKLDNTSPKADDDFIDGEKVKDSGKGFVQGGNSNTKKDDESEGEELKNKGGNFKKADNKSPKSDDKFIDGDPIIDKKGKGFQQGGSVTPKADDKGEGEKVSDTGKGFKKLDNKSKPEKLKESVRRRPRRKKKGN